jgi:transmembrane sensor
MWNPSDALLARYLAGEATDAESRDVGRWAAGDPAHRARIDELRAIWQARRPIDWDVDGMWASVRRTIRADRHTTPRIGRAFPASRRPWVLPAAAAAVVLLALGASFLIFAASPRAPAASAALPMRQYATPRGQRGTVQLPDGTRLMLAAASRLRIPNDFGRGAREVLLEGEALFDVVHDSTHPFRVRTMHAVAEDIGTRFVVRAYPEDSAVAVAVAEGQVALGRIRSDSTDHAGSTTTAAEGVVLGQDEVGTLAPSGEVSTARGAADYLAWTDGRLAFNQTPLPEALAAIGRWYDLDVRVEGPALRARTISAEFSLQSADDMLRALALAVNARVARSGGHTVTLRAR